MIRLDKHSLIKGYKKAEFYISNFAQYGSPTSFYRMMLKRKISSLSPSELAEAQSRARYYARVPEGTPVGEGSIAIKDFKYPFGQKKKFSAYFFDLYKITRYFPLQCRIKYLFGDVNTETDSPTLTKSRPIAQGHTMNVVMRLNQLRHFKFVNDTTPFADKIDRLIFRNEVREQPHRSKFISMYFGHPMCDIGQINECAEHPEYQKPYMPIDEQLKYKFICCIEGHDVATNLKWVMSSQSIAVMPKPKMESWYMEGQLVGDYHYIQIKDDYSDLEEKLHFYISHPEKAQEIIKHAHEWVHRFRNPKTELATSLLTLQLTLSLTGQLPV